MKKIEARLLKGFRDFIGDEVYRRRKVMSVFQTAFEKYGYEPLETPALEYFDVLMGKYGEEEKLVYQFDDFGKRRVALKYDLTVPTTRVYAQYKEKLPTPWKRYQMQPVWRADNTQKGRFREFWQCDADILGTSSMIADSEYIKMGIEILQNLGFKDFIVRLNNRKILNAIAQYANREDKFIDIVYAIDKWEKRTLQQTIKDLQERGLTDPEISKIMQCIDTSSKSNEIKLADLSIILKDTKDGASGINELLEIIKLVDDVKLRYDPTIARGLSYYTGPVWEWNIIEGGVGSVGGCGRYDKLIGSFLGSEVPATGGSFGIERIIEVMKDRDMFGFDTPVPDCLVTIIDEKYTKECFVAADSIRKTGIKTIIYPDIKPMKKQIEYALKRKAKFLVIIGEDEIKAGKISLKDLASQQQSLLTLEEACNKMLEL
jgi:histidyl-tRNA synthetase